ncbi:MAG: ATP F0F1 synthase subunit B [Caulobacteraceae bacterium]|nr:ATP F0F1 synthase subunit B [Caulobacteraceae bacterium]
MSALINPQDAHFWIFIALLAFAFILWRAKVPRMAVQALDDAGAKVQAQLDEAALLRDEARALLEEIKVKREETDRAAAEMLADAQADAERLRGLAVLELEEEIRRMGQLAERKIAVAEAQAAAEVKAAAADLAAHAAETVLAARIAGATTDPLIDAGLKGLASRFS